MNEKILLKVIKHASENVPFYIELYSKNKVNFNNLNCFDDFKEVINKLPIVKKQVFLDSDYSILSKKSLNKYNEKELISIPTSGSTGKCLNVFWDETDYKKSLLPLWMLRKKRNGITPKDNPCFFFTNQYFENRVIRCEDIIFNANQMLVNKSNWDEFRLKSIVEEIIKFKPKWMILQPSIAQLLCQCIQENNLAFPNTLKYIELSGEMLYPSVRKTIKKVFDCEIANQYGTNEVNAIAYECRYGNMHVLEGCNYVEIIKNNIVVPFGKEGDIHVTSLLNYTMPFIRYETGDQGLLLPPNKCKCGCNSPILKLTKGRSNDWVLNSDGSKVHSYIFVQIIETINDLMDNIIRQFQIVQENYGAFTVKLVIEHNKNKLELDKTMICKLFTENILQNSLAGSNFFFEFYESLFPNERTGKLRYFISRIIE